MRRIAQSNNQALLDRFNAFLEKEGVNGILIEEPSGWGLWVDDEGHVSAARQWYAEYQLAPNADRYLEAEQARDIRRREKEQETNAEFETGRLRDQRDPTARRGFSLRRLRRAPAFPVRRGFTLGLVAMTLFGALLIDFNLTSPNGQWMAFCQAPRTTTGLATLNDILSGECWRLISPSFVYFDLRHLFFGVIFLYHFGIRIESLRGPIVLGSLCLGAAVVTNAVQAVAPVDVAIPGLAGGAVFGGMSSVVFALFGFIWIQSTRFRDDLLRVDGVTIFVMLIWQVICIASPDWGFANVGHLAGLIFGMAIGWLYTPRHSIVAPPSNDEQQPATEQR